MERIKLGDYFGFLTDRVCCGRERVGATQNAEDGPYNTPWR